MSSLKNLVNIQSFSDLITNSSSELFCIITGEDLESLYDTLGEIFNYEGLYDEINFGIDLIDDERIEITYPYGRESSLAFYKAGLEAMVDDKYTMKFNDDENSIYL